MMRLSLHFVANWKDRVGSTPTEAMVRDILQTAVRVQKGQKLLALDGQPFNTLTIYWNPDLKLILYVDHFNDTAVSVLGRDNAPESKPGYYTPMTMHSAARRRQ